MATSSSTFDQAFINHSFANKRSDVFPTKSSIQWQMMYRVSDSSCDSPSNQWFYSEKDIRSQETLHLCLMSGASSADIHFSAQFTEKVMLNPWQINPMLMTDQTKKHSGVNIVASGRATAKKGIPLNLGIPFKESTPGQTALSLSVIKVIPFVKAPSNLTLPFILQSTLESQSNLNDITLYFGAEKEAVKVSKFMLMARSTVFEKMFQAGLKEQESNEVFITDIKPAVGKEMVTYIYTDEAPNIEELAEELWLAADKYQLHGLKALCENLLVRQLKLENAAHTLLFADKFCGPGKLRGYTVRFITKNKDTYTQVMRSEEWSEVRKLPELFHEVNDKYFNIVSPEPPAKKPRIV